MKGCNLFGREEKRSELFRIYCLPEEKRRWKARYGRKLGEKIREILNGLASEPRSTKGEETLDEGGKAVVGLKASESELFLWTLGLPARGIEGRPLGGRYFKHGPLVRAKMNRLVKRKKKQ